MPPSQPVNLLQKDRSAKDVVSQLRGPAPPPSSRAAAPGGRVGPLVLPVFSGAWSLCCSLQNVNPAPRKGETLISGADGAPAASLPLLTRNPLGLFCKLLQRPGEVQSELSIFGKERTQRKKENTWHSRSSRSSQLRAEAGGLRSTVSPGPGGRAGREGLRSLGRGSPAAGAHPRADARRLCEKLHILRIPGKTPGSQHPARGTCGFN